MYHIPICISPQFGGNRATKAESLRPHRQGADQHCTHNFLIDQDFLSLFLIFEVHVDYLGSEGDFLELQCYH